ncbi:DUF4019 domain-containing protein [Marinobacter sp. JSM 1782161]|uniref:DUF4019 domain-containing protein n=1 Tax=Marinobacter sp. JSM 1782161 TaxID=2685906 RepID=UPI0014034CF1|nr:DUF4019 domain-containing protein [Marinobacter sp. JSM 1782161]
MRAYVAGALLVLVSMSPVVWAESSEDKNLVKQQEQYLYWMDQQTRNQVAERGEKVTEALDRIVRDGADVWNLYNRASQTLRDRYDFDAFKQAMKERTKLGVSENRIFAGVDGGFKRLPNLPGDREYAIVKYDVTFQNHDLLYTEQVTLEKTEDTSSASAWRVVGYFVGKKPFYMY